MNSLLKMGERTQTETGASSNRLGSLTLVDLKSHNPAFGRGDMLIFKRNSLAFVDLTYIASPMRIQKVGVLSFMVSM